MEIPEFLYIDIGNKNNLSKSRKKNKGNRDTKYIQVHSDVDTSFLLQTLQVLLN